MPPSVTLIKAEQQAKSDRNAEARAAFLADYPMFGTLPYDFTDNRGLNWRAEYIYETNAIVSVSCRWINDDADPTEFYTSYNAIDFSRFMFSFIYSDTLGTEPPNTKYSIPELKDGIVDRVEIDGTPIASWDFDPDISIDNFTLKGATTSGQDLAIFYRNKQYNIPT